MSSRARVVRSTLVATVCALLAGCVQMPSDGPVVEPEVNAEVEDAPGISFDPRPPRSGESPTEIVEGFLEAMKATPIRPPTVARQFLSRAAADTWGPEQQVITYADRGSLTGASTVEIPMTDVNLYDARGAWQRTRAARDLDLQLVQEDGEWRIDQVPDALIVPDSWFDDWYQRVSLYFFDPTSQVLVPEPVFMPRGDQLASSLVRGLLTPPPVEDQDVTRTYFPVGTAPGLSVPVEDGIADVALSGDPDAIDEETAERMLAQLVWTLRQEPRIGAVQLSVGGRVFDGTGGSGQVNLGFGSEYDPNGARPSTDMFALDRGRVVSGAIGDFTETFGPLGADDYGLRAISVSVSGSHVAGVSATGSDLFLAPTEAPDGELVAAISGGLDLAAPAWDNRDRAWVLDRGAGRAQVFVVVDGVASVVEVPGLSGLTVTQLLVSRDGSRLVAVVRDAKADRVVATRVRHDAAGTVLGFTPLRTLPLPPEGSPRIRDVAWRSPTSVSVLSNINEDYSQVRTISVDGAPGEIDTGDTTRSRDRIRSLVSSPVDLAEVFALAGRTVISLTRPERSVPDLPQGLRSLTYAG